MPEPTLSEITNITVDAERASGEPAVVYDQTEFVRGLTQQAQFKAENDWRKYTHFMDNLKEVYKNMDNIQATEVMQEDRPYLQEQAATVFEEIAKNPRAIYSPELQQKIGKLRADTTTSKQDNLFDTAHRKFIATTPELNNEGNKKKMEEFRKKGLGKRDPYNLDMPVLFDIDSFHETLIKNPSVAIPFAENTVTEDDKYVIEEEGVDFKRDEYLKAWDAAYDAKQDKYGQSISGYVNQLYNQLPEDQKEEWDKKGGAKAFWHFVGEQRFGQPSDYRSKTKSNRQYNPGYMKEEEMKLAKERINQEWKRLNLDERKLNNIDTEDQLGAANVVNEMVDILKKGNPINVDVGGKKKKFIEIGDPELLKTFAAIDKDGKTTNIPDAVHYDPEKDEFKIIYYQKDDEGKIATTKSGKRIQIDDKTMNGRTWAKTITRRSFPNKNIGSINNMVDQIITASGNNMWELTQKWGQPDKEEDKKDESATPVNKEELRKKYNY